MAGMTERVLIEIIKNFENISNSDIRDYIMLLTIREKVSLNKIMKLSKELDINNPDLPRIYATVLRDKLGDAEFIKDLLEKLSEYMNKTDLYNVVYEISLKEDI